MALKPNEVKFRKKHENSECEPCGFLFPFICLFLFLGSNPSMSLKSDLLKLKVKISGLLSNFITIELMVFY